MSLHLHIHTESHSAQRCPQGGLLGNSLHFKAQPFGRVSVKQAEVRQIRASFSCLGGVTIRRPFTLYRITQIALISRGTAPAAGKTEGKISSGQLLAPSLVQPMQPSAQRDSKVVKE